MRLRGVNDSSARLVICPKCGKQLMYVSKETEGKIYPYCKVCRKNVSVNICRKPG